MNRLLLFVLLLCPLLARSASVPFTAFRGTTPVLMVTNPSAGTVTASIIAGSAGQVLTTTAGVAGWADPTGGSGTASTMLQTNFVLNQVYTNATTSPVLINAASFLITAAVNGNCSLDLMYAPTGSVTWVNIARSAISTTIAGALTLPITNSIAGVVTNLGTYYFTNTSSGAGNSAGLVSGTGQITTLGGPAGATGAGGGSLETNANQFGASVTLTLKSGVQTTNLANNGLLGSDGFLARSGFGLSDQDWVGGFALYSHPSSINAEESPVSLAELNRLVGVTGLIQPALSNNVRVVAGDGSVTVTPSGSGGVMTYSLTSSGGGGSGGTNYPPVISIGTNITVGVGVRQSLNIITNASFKLVYTGTPLNGEDIKWTVNNWSNITIYVTNTYYDKGVASNVTITAIPALSIKTIKVVSLTNNNVGVARWELDGYVQKEAELAAAGGNVLHTNFDGSIITVSNAVSGSTQGFYNVKDYGAVGDGTTDDTVAVTNALFAMPATGGTMYFPSTALGYYLPGGNITVSKNVTILGDGMSTVAVDPSSAPLKIPLPAATKILMSHATASLFTFTTNSGSIRNILLANTNLLCTAGALVTCTSPARQKIDFDGVTFFGGYMGVYHSVGNAWNAHNCFFQNQIRYGILIRNLVNPDSGDWSIDNCTFVSFFTNTAGILFESSGGGKIVNTKFNAYSTNCIKASMAGLTSILLIDNCSFENYLIDGIYGDGIFAGFTIGNCQFGHYATAPALGYPINLTNGFGNLGKISGITVLGATNPVVKLSKVTNCIINSIVCNNQVASWTQDTNCRRIYDNNNIGSSLTDSWLIRGSMEFQSLAKNNTSLGDNVYYDGTNYRHRSNGPASRIHFIGSGSTGASEIQLRTAVSNAAENVAAVVPNVKMNSDGTVAIGGGISGTVGTYTGAALTAGSNNVAVNVTMSAPTNSAAFNFLTNNFVSGQVYTNNPVGAAGGQRAFVQATVTLTNILSTDVAIMALWVDQDGDGTFESKGKEILFAPVVALSASQEILCSRLQPNSRFVFTNLSTGTASSGIRANSSEIIRE